MALSPLKFSLIVSVLVHGLVIGGVVWLGKFQRTAAVMEMGDTTALELIAASTSAIESTTVSPATPAPASAPAAVPPPLEDILPQKISEPPPEAETPVPVSPLGETVVAPITATATPTATPRPPTITVPANISGDSSSPLPGKDYTTTAGNSLILAEPIALNLTEPEYPLAARRRGQEGTVLLRVAVNVQGEVAAVVILESSGYELLDQAAFKFARTWKFTPARLGSRPVESTVERPVRFKLNR